MIVEKLEPFEGFLEESPQFLREFTNHFRGSEVSTFFSTWAGIITISALLKRETWIDWFDSKLFANLYVLLLAPSGFGKKTAIIDSVGDILEQSVSHLRSRTRSIKRPFMIRNYFDKKTLVEALDPGSKPWMNSKLTIEGETYTYEKGSDITILVPDLSNVANNKSDVNKIIPMLVDIYDTHDEFLWRRQGSRKIERLYTVFFGGTTHNMFSRTIPVSAMSEGFLSRCLILSQTESPRIVSRPYIPKNARSIQRLAEKAAFIAESAMGRMSLSDEAQKEYDTWYRDIRMKLSYSPEPAKAPYSRIDIHVLKVAMILAAMESTKTITAGHVRLATRILEETIYRSRDAIKSIGMAPVTHMHMITDIMKRAGGRMTWEGLARETELPTKQLQPAISALYETGRITARRVGPRGNGYSPQKPKFQSENEMYVLRKDHGAATD